MKNNGRILLVSNRFIAKEQKVEVGQEREAKNSWILIWLLKVKIQKTLISPNKIHWSIRCKVTLGSDWRAQKKMRGRANKKIGIISLKKYKTTVKKNREEA